MRVERLDIATNGVAFDTETHRTQPGLNAPPLVCGSVATSTTNGELLSKKEAFAVYKALLSDSRKTIIGANIAYDNAVMAQHAIERGEDILPHIFAAYGGEDPTAGRFFDIQLAEALHAVAGAHLNKDPHTKRKLVNRETGKRAGYSLDNVTELVTGRTDAKASDEWRLRYAELEDVPIAEWPELARQYPRDDANNTFECALIQSTTRRNLHDLSVQAYTAWALHLASCWGLRTDREATEALASAAQTGRDRAQERFRQIGFLREDNTENGAVVMRAVAIAYGCSGTCTECVEGKIYGVGKKGQRIGQGKRCTVCSGTGLDLSTGPVPRSPTGLVQIGRDQLNESGDDLLREYAASMEDDKVLDTYIPFLRRGYDVPITPRANVILETGRVSYRDSAQTLPRSVSAHLSEVLKERGIKVKGVRDCIVPRAGYWFYSNDYTGGELVTHAESCVNLVGFSKMGEALIGGKDVHSALGATMLGVTYDQFLTHPKKKPFRQAAKALNFGLPGGMGVLKLVAQQRAQGPDTPWHCGSSQVWDGEKFVPGYKGLRFCVLVGGAEACGIEKVTEWRDRMCAPTCVACIKIATELKETWSSQWPENRVYFQKVAGMLDVKPEIVQHYSGRIRGFDGDNAFTSAANGFFQAFLADIAKRAQCRVSFEQYAVKTSPLYGSRSLIFAHDELFGEARADVAAEVSERVNEIMIEEFRRGCPHHAKACKAEPTIMRRWYKAAECVRDANGRLLPWEPKW